MDIVTFILAFIGAGFILGLIVIKIADACAFVKDVKAFEKQTEEKLKGQKLWLESLQSDSSDSRSRLCVLEELEEKKTLPGVRRKR